jgi:cytochrome c556
MTAEEQAFSALMLSINPAFTAVRGGLDTPDATAMRAQLQTLRQAFTTVQAFFKERGTTDAAGWATDSLRMVGSIETALAGGKLDDLKTSIGSLQQLCASCHNEHRERMDDGTFRIRGGQ